MQFRALLLAGAMLTLPAAALPTAALAQEQSAATEVEGLVATGERARSAAVTGLDLSIKETPQSVTQLTQERIQQFGLTDTNILLEQVTGVNVERVETDRTYYNSRGFDITNVQVDGVGLPLIWGIQFGALDTAFFEKVEVVRGANSMMTGTGNPSATINYTRKRPKMMTGGSFAVEGGSWDNVRIDADLTGPLNDSGTLRGRLIAAHDAGDSYLNYNSHERNALAGLLAFDINERLTATLGYALNDNRSNGVLWGALPLQYSDGTFIDHDESASTSADWTFWDVKDQTAFAELDYAVGADWRLKGTITFKQFDELAKLLYAYNNPDPVTGLGVEGMTGIYPSSYQSYIFDAFAAGPVTLFGRQHQVVLGGQASRSTGTEYENFYLGPVVYPALQDWGRLQVTEPTFPGDILVTEEETDLYRAYAAIHLDLSDRLKGVLGVNALQLKSSGYSYGTDVARDESAISPYLGAVYDVTPNVSVYASYTDIFNPQSEVDINYQKLDPAHGESYEAGIKSEWLNSRLMLTAAVFKTRQEDFASYVGDHPNGDSYYTGVESKVSGYELEAVGRLTDAWSLGAGWTDLEIKDASGAEARLFMPRQTLKVMTTYEFPDLRNLTLGAALRWQSDIYGFDLSETTQDSYAIVDLTAGVDVTQNVRATLNIRNVADEKHLASLSWNQAFYGEPRNVSLRLNYRF